ncbi:MAG: mannose-6-phosphate isomerase, partial [Angelakisella sp.]
QRLLVQTHPNKALAQRYFHSPYGKTEAWYVLEAQHGACIYAGFREGVTPEQFRKLIEAQDTEQILGCLHRFEISPGDVVFIPGGMPHAMGAGSLVAEIQEPTDITLRAERIRPDGSVLPPESLHSGIGMDGLIECFRFDCRDRESTRRAVFVTPTDLGKGEQQLIGSAQTDCFGLRLVTVSCALQKRNSRFVIGLTLSGSGTLTVGDMQLRLHQGSEFFIPNTVQEYSYNADPGETPLVLLECDPPALTENK